MLIHVDQPHHPQHWSEVDQDPNGVAAVRLVRDYLRDTYRGRVPDFLSVINRYTPGKSVLDIGVVAHTRDFIDRPDWRHRIIKGLASRVVGCDIIESEVAYLQSLGFDVRPVDATSDVDLGERFEVVYIGDVIEHVNDPMKLLSFAARHLEPNGSIVVTTPCPFWWKFVLQCLKERPFIGNVDHVTWITPFDAVELAHRASLRLVGWHLVQNLGGNAGARLVHKMRDFAGLGDSELFAWAYAYIFANER